jgi:hypothetical protein
MSNTASRRATRVTVNGQLFNADINPSLNVTGTVSAVAASGTLASYEVAAEGSRRPTASLRLR